MAEDKPIAEECQQLIARLDRATKLHPREIEKEIDQIQRATARLRDRLIDHLRNPQMTADSSRQKSDLDGVNTALSLIVAVEYPVTSIQRSALQQARELLKTLAEDRPSANWTRVS